MKNNIRTLVLLKVLLLFGGILFYSNILRYPLSCTDNNFILDVKPDSSASDVATILEEKFCVNSTLFKLVIYTTFNQKNIKPGLYSLKHTIDVMSVISLSGSTYESPIATTGSIDITSDERTFVDFLSGSFTLLDTTFYSGSLDLT